MERSTGDSSSGNEQVLFPAEAEAHVSSLVKFSIPDIGCTQQWQRQREYLHKLNMQAVQNASQQSDEFVKEFLISHEKLGVLIHELIAVRLWKDKVFSLLSEGGGQKPKSTFPCYVVLYHEATIINLLETVLFYKESVEAVGDVTLDLVDYCHQCVTWLIANHETVPVEQQTTDDTLQELQQLNCTLNYGISIKALSVLQSFVTNLDCLPLSVTTRLLNTHDIPGLLVSVMDQQPWVRKDKNGKLLKHIEGKWRDVSPADRLQLTKTEAQVWISLYQLLMSPECQKKYHLHAHNKNHIMRLRSHLLETVVDQIPQLSELQRYLGHLSVMDPPASSSSDLVLEQVPEIYDQLVRQNNNQWRKIADQQRKKLFLPSDSDLQQQAKRWVEACNWDVLETLSGDAPKCAQCGQTSAMKRCSRCRSEWYCGRECQVKHWKKHKPFCDTISSSTPH
ncbi:zinc finger MYND domain-containing protein 10-like [Dysidea avara]|uniref:zinc finger MYND domain-containing protein 10-like n=1 Tax=Dysidea avara TaxID=196820 RepID=UPI0033263FA9